MLLVGRFVEGSRMRLGTTFSGLTPWSGIEKVEVQTKAEVDVSNLDDLRIQAQPLITTCYSTRQFLAGLNLSINLIGWSSRDY